MVSATEVVLSLAMTCGSRDMLILIICMLRMRPQMSGPEPRPLCCTFCSSHTVDFMDPRNFCDLLSCRHAWMKFTSLNQYLRSNCSCNYTSGRPLVIWSLSRLFYFTPFFCMRWRADKYLILSSTSPLTAVSIISMSVFGRWCLHSPYYRPCLVSGGQVDCRGANGPSASNAMRKRATCVAESLLAISMTRA